ncbi:hypothetical protein ACERC8_01420 [Streptococcus sp. E29BA]|uniref:hypothetical protein n=1 Tax=Streptococcus sp. E29BA TaxID=3278716 RepID=UPI00359ED173
MKLDDIINKLREEIAEKDSLNFSVADERVLSFISVYRHGIEPYRTIAKEWLIRFAINNGFVRNKREVIV